MAFVLTFTIMLTSIPINLVFAYDDADDIGNRYQSSELGPQTPSESFGASIESRSSRLGALQPIRFEEQNRGLMGFSGNYALPDDDIPVTVVVVFQSQPASTQVAAAYERGVSLSASIAYNIAEGDHALFRQELDALFSLGGIMPFGAAYNIGWEYRNALNGVTVTLPANMVAELANFASVRAVYPNFTVTLPPVQPETIVQSLSDRNPIGMAPGRASLQADALHAEGYRGEGLVVAVIDTGIDYNHPAFAGAFLSLEEMQQRNPNVTAADTINGTFYGRNFILWGPGAMPTNDPMESPPGMGGPNMPGAMHGTHVAGTIVGRDTGGDVSILGVAPEARMFAYRVLGPDGSGTIADIIASVEKTAYDRPDVVNMSLGGISNLSTDVMAVAVNNIMLANPEMVFVIAAGNAGPGYYTVGTPTTSGIALSVGNTIDGYVGLMMESYDFSAPAFFTNALDFGNSMWVYDSTTGRFFNRFENLQEQDGNYRVFIMPLTQFSYNPADNIGSGQPQDFAALAARYSPEELAGAFVLVRRGSYFSVVAEQAYALGLGGIISVSGPMQDAGQGGANIPGAYIPYMMLYHADGLRLRNLILEQEGPYALISFTGNVGTAMSMSPDSSRGPVRDNLEVNPHLVANGSSVLSAAPWWTVENAAGDYYGAYVAISGTSMAAPHIAGAAALMIQYSRQNNIGTGVGYNGARQWSHQEIMVRMMNTAWQFNENGYGVFDKGAGHPNIWAAVNTDVAVYIEFDRVVSSAGQASTLTGAFNFGGMNQAHEDAQPLNSTINATVANYSNATRTFTLVYNFIDTGRRSQDPTGNVTLTLSDSIISVPAGGTASIWANMTMFEDADNGHYEGFIYLYEGSVRLASMPFAGVVTHNMPSMTNMFLSRSVISTGPSATGLDARYLTLNFEPHNAFGMNIWVLHDVEGINQYNWRSPEFIDARVGFVGGGGFGHEDLFMTGLGTLHRSFVFDGTFWELPDHHEVPLPYYSYPQRRLTNEGHYLLLAEVVRVYGGSLVHDFDVIFPFEVNNTPPVISGLRIGDELYHTVTFDGMGGMVIPVSVQPTIPADPEEDELVIRGNVFDYWTLDAMQRDITFGIWQQGAPYGPETSMVNNVGLWAVIGENEPENRPTRIQIAENGDFELPIDTAEIELPVNVSLWAMNGVAPHPAFGAYPGTDIYETYSTYHFSPELATEPFPEYLLDHVYLSSIAGFGFYDLLRDHVWHGINITQMSLTLAEDDLMVHVGEIVGAQTYAIVGETMELTGTVLPLEAAFTDITWEITYGGHRASIDGNTITGIEQGIIRVLATVPNGLITADFTQEFTMAVLNGRVDITHYFTDFAFAVWVRNYHHLPSDASIYNFHVSTIWHILAPGWGITSLDGLEHFMGLQYLEVPFNQLEGGLDMSGFDYLLGIDVRGSNLTSINLTQNPLLHIAYIYDNLFDTVDLSQNPRLMRAAVGNFFQLISGRRQLSELILGYHPYMTHLDVSFSRITELDLSGTPSLEFLDAFSNRLTTLDIRDTRMRYLDVESNFLTGPDDVLGWRDHNLHLFEGYFDFIGPEWDWDIGVFFFGVQAAPVPPEFLVDPQPDNGFIGVPFMYMHWIHSYHLVTWSVVEGVGTGLPPGIYLGSPGGGQNMVFYFVGTPTMGGVFDFRIRATNDFGYTEFDIELIIWPAPLFTPEISWMYEGSTVITWDILQPNHTLGFRVYRYDHFTQQYEPIVELLWGEDYYDVFFDIVDDEPNFFGVRALPFYPLDESLTSNILTFGDTDMEPPPPFDRLRLPSPVLRHLYYTQDGDHQVDVSGEIWWETIPNAVEYLLTVSHSNHGYDMVWDFIIPTGGNPIVVDIYDLDGLPYHEAFSIVVTAIANPATHMNSLPSNWLTYEIIEKTPEPGTAVVHLYPAEITVPPGSGVVLSAYVEGMTSPIFHHYKWAIVGATSSESGNTAWDNCYVVIVCRYEQANRFYVHLYFDDYSPPGVAIINIDPNAPPQFEIVVTAETTLALPGDVVPFSVDIVGVPSFPLEHISFGVIGGTHTFYFSVDHSEWLLYISPYEEADYLILRGYGARRYGDMVEDGREIFGSIDVSGQTIIYINHDIERLDAPVPIFNEALNTIEWPSIPNAVEYHVYQFAPGGWPAMVVPQDSGIISADLDELWLDVGYNYIWIRAIGDRINYIDSFASEPVAVYIEAGEITISISPEYATVAAGGSLDVFANVTGMFFPMVFWETIGAEHGETAVHLYDFFLTTEGTLHVHQNETASEIILRASVFDWENDVEIYDTAVITILPPLTMPIYPYEPGYYYEESEIPVELCELNFMVANQAFAAAALVFTRVFEHQSIFADQFQPTTNVSTLAAATLQIQVPDGEVVGNRMPTAQRQGYTFIGWNTAADGSGTPFVGNTVITGDITVFAQWQPDGDEPGSQPPPQPPQPPVTVRPSLPRPPAVRDPQPPTDDIEYPAADDEETLPTRLAPPPPPPPNRLVFTADNINYVLNNQTRVGVATPFIDTATDRMMVPLYTLANALDIVAEWDAGTASAILHLPTGTMIVPMDTPLPDGMGMPTIVNNRAFVPLRFVMYAFNAGVVWDGANRAGIITW